MITTVTGKNRITIPAAIANRVGLKSGSGIDWQLSSKPDEIRCIEEMSEEELRLVHEILLHAEKDRLWREISAEAEDERTCGKWEHLPEIIPQPITPAEFISRSL